MREEFSSRSVHQIRVNRFLSQLPDFGPEFFKDRVLNFSGSGKSPVARLFLAQDFGNMGRQLPDRAPVAFNIEMALARRIGMPSATFRHLERAGLISHRLPQALMRIDQ